MFDFRMSYNIQKPDESIAPGQAEKRQSDCRRNSFDTKYLGMGKCIDRRKADRRTTDRFNEVEYERLCQKRLGPGWL